MPRLTEQEQQEIIRYIEADKPLPDKFRFLLFEDKREMELESPNTLRNLSELAAHQDPARNVQEGDQRPHRAGQRQRSNP
jgi:hypothetical protein